MTITHKTGWVTNRKRGLKMKNSTFYISRFFNLHRCDRKKKNTRSQKICVNRFIN